MIVKQCVGLNSHSVNAQRETLDRVSAVCSSSHLVCIFIRNRFIKLANKNKTDNTCHFVIKVYFYKVWSFLISYFVETFFFQPVQQNKCIHH